MKSAQMKISEKGFTLIELLVVVAIIAALAVAVFVALNPAQRLKDTRIARRTTDVDTILTAIHTYIVDSKGAYPPSMNITPGNAYPIHEIGSAGTGCDTGAGASCPNTAAACVNLGADLVKYLHAMPIDPLGTPTYPSDGSKTGYAVAVDANGIVTVTSCADENTQGGGTAITASR
jgi:prepilin-type N-terminal cleavage/methylation domain-containing protein